MCSTATIFELEFVAVRVNDIAFGLLSHSKDFDLSDFAFAPTTVEILVRDEEDEESVETITHEALRVEVNGQDPWMKIAALVRYMEAAEYLVDRFGDCGITPTRVHRRMTLVEY